METLLQRVVLLVSMALAPGVSAALLYVSPGSPNPVAPYDNWSTAAANIQDAIDASSTGDVILVTNGVYRAGGRSVAPHTLTNRVVIDKAITVQSVNGPATTIIEGAPHPGAGSGFGSRAVRCVHLGPGAILDGFTLRHGFTADSGDALHQQSGGGAWCGPGARIRNCVVNGNSAKANGGGVCGGTFYNCEIALNSAAFGGGAYGAMVFNCTVVKNQSTSRSLGGGTAVCTNYNSIVEYNVYTYTANYAESAFYFSCTTPVPPGGAGNITNAPGFVDLEGGIFRLQCGSPCIDAGTNLASLFMDDLRGGPRPADGNGDGVARFDMGAHERNPENDARDLAIRSAFKNFAVGFPASFTAQMDGCASPFWWDFGDGTRLTNQLEVAHAWAAPGVHAVTLNGFFPLSDVVGVVTTLVYVVEATYYVDAANTSPSFPYATWATAATNIQDAVDAGTTLGRLVLVTNGVYRHGGRAVHGIMTNRVTLTNGVFLKSVNGYGHTIIEGATSPGGGPGNGAVRGIYVGTLSRVDGFTITNGFTLKSSNVNRPLLNGGGIYCEADAEVINCLLIGNWADYEGGGVGGDAVGQGRLYRCTLTENTAYHGGGAAYTILSDCLVVSNRLWTAGGGGGTHWSTLYNCTVIGNSAGFDSGVHGGSIYNSIVYHNVPEDHGSGKFYYSCTTPLPVGPGNLELEPAFVDAAAGDFRLNSNSICINAGRNAYVARPADISGAPRIVGGTVDIGAYEHQTPSSTLSYAWAAQHGLPTDGSADHTDPDGDGMSNWAEWRSATNPTNAASVLKVSSIGASSAGTGTLLTWQSVGGVLYSVERSSMLSGEPAFVTIASDIVGLTEATTYVDSMPPGGGARFYRIRAGD